MAFFSKDIWRKIFFIKTALFFKTDSVFSSDSVLVYSRKSTIPLCFRGQTVSIHKGLVSRKLQLTHFNTNSKFGEYAYTRKLYYYPLKKKNRR